MRTALSRALALSLILCSSALAAIERPFVLWNKQDLAAIRQKCQNEPWAKEVYEADLKKCPDLEVDLFDLLRFAAMDDAAAGQRQKAKLMKTVTSKPPYGGAQWINVVRYDLLYGQLTAEERGQVEKLFREYIEQAIFTNAVKDGTDAFNDKADYSRYDAYLYGRSNWLPNIIWPRRISANLMAAALGDEKLIRRAWGAYGSVQWYIDDYLSDGGFYSEEFSKIGSTPGEMLLYCRAVERLGLNELGFGYTGRGGASIRGHIESTIKQGYPRVDLGTDRPTYPILTLGDVRRGGSSTRSHHPTHAFQHSLVPGYMADGKGGNLRFITQGAWGGEIRGDNPQWDGYSGFTPKMIYPLWFEIAQQKWPESHFDYFLAQMRAPGEARYIPSLYLGLDPIDPAKVKPPPALSYIAPQRGIAMLRYDESPAYWESPAPAVAMRLTAPYAHSVNDPLAILGYYALNRPIYLNRNVTLGYAAGWTRSVLSHNSVCVDGKEPAATDSFTTRHGFFPPLKFVAVNTQKVYPGIDQTRALFLTDRYLLDVSRLSAADGQPHEYTWMAHTLGRANTEQGKWSEPRQLGGLLAPFGKARALTTADGAPWRVEAKQLCCIPPEKAVLPKSWYEKEIGVTLAMLPAAGTSVLLADTPLADTPDKTPKLEDKPQDYEVGGVSVIVSRKAASTTFAVVSVPTAKALPRTLASFTTLSEGEDHIAAAIDVRDPGDAPVSADLLMLQWGDLRSPITIDKAGRQITFASYCLIRTHPDKIEVWGDLRRLRLPTTLKQPTLILNNRLTSASIENGCLVFGRPPTTSPATTQASR